MVGLFNAHPSEGMGQPPQTDTLFLIRNFPFAQLVKAWGRLPPPESYAGKIVYVDMIVPATAQTYRLSFQARDAQDLEHRRSLQWFIYQMELLK